MRSRFLCVTTLCVLTLSGLLLVPVALSAALIGLAPNQLVAPLLEYWPLFNILWASNPGAALPTLWQQPVFSFGHREPGSGLLAWGVFFYPLPLALLLGAALMAARTLCGGHYRAIGRCLISLLPGMALLLFAVTYVQLASCCTGGPRWTLDVWLFSLIYDPLSPWTGWQELYLRIEGWLVLGQLALALLGMFWLVTAIRRRKV
jgi:hypothetical protein